MKVGGTIYYKYRVNLPIKFAEDSKPLDKEVKVKMEGKKIVIEKE